VSGTCVIATKERRFEKRGGQAEDVDVDWSSYGNFEGIFGPVSHVTTGASSPELQSPSSMTSQRLSLGSIEIA